MKIYLLFFVLAAFYSSSLADDCKPPFHYIGSECTGICGNCVDKKSKAATNTCLKNGTCHHQNECLTGWSGPDCKTPKCEQGCGSGTCIGSNVCFCGSDINRVGDSCADIRVRGIIGSIAAFAVLTSSIALCGLGSKMYAKRREGASI